MPASRPTSAPDARLFTLLFIAWCFVAGTLLMYAPWMPVWTRWVSGVDTPWLHRLLLHPTFRGAVSGFGLFHLVWGTHDLDHLLATYLRRREPRDAVEPDAGSGPPGTPRAGGEGDVE